MAKKTNEFTLVTTLADSDTLTGVQGGNLDIGISAASLKGRMNTLVDVGGYFATDTVEAALQQLGAAMAAINTAYQPADSDLTAIAALTTTPFGRSLLTVADATALLSTAGAQPVDSDLTAIAALGTTSFGRSLLTMVNGPATLAAIGAQPADSDLDAIATLTTQPFGRSLLTQADAAAARTTLGATPTASPTFTGVVTVPDASTATGAVSKQQMDTATNLKVDKATMTTDGDLITRTGGNPSRITRASLAADPAFTTAFQAFGTPGPQGPTGATGPVGPAGPRRDIKNDTTTAYAPILTDENLMVTLSNANPISVTLPSDATQAFPIGVEIDFLWLGVGRPTFVAGSGATVYATPTLNMRARYSAASAKKIAANTWVVLGDLGV